jgi:hypothetical protein
MIGWLVQDQQVRLHRERAGKPGTSAFTPRQRLHIPMEILREVTQPAQRSSYSGFRQESAPLLVFIDLAGVFAGTRWIGEVLLQFPNTGTQSRQG